MAGATPKQFASANYKQETPVSTNTSQTPCSAKTQSHEVLKGPNVRGGQKLSKRARHKRAMYKTTKSVLSIARGVLRFLLFLVAGLHSLHEMTMTLWGEVTRSKESKNVTTNKKAQGRGKKAGGKSVSSKSQKDKDLHGVVYTNSKITTFKIESHEGGGNNTRNDASKISDNPHFQKRKRLRKHKKKGERNKGKTVDNEVEEEHTDDLKSNQKEATDAEIEHDQADVIDKDQDGWAVARSKASKKRLKAQLAYLNKISEQAELSYDEDESQLGEDFRQEKDENPADSEDANVQFNDHVATIDSKNLELDDDDNDVQQKEDIVSSSSKEEEKAQSDNHVATTNPEESDLNEEAKKAEEEKEGSGDEEQESGEEAGEEGEDDWKDEDGEDGEEQYENKDEEDEDGEEEYEKGDEEDEEEEEEDEKEEDEGDDNNPLSPKGGGKQFDDHVVVSNSEESELDERLDDDDDVEQEEDNNSSRTEDENTESAQPNATHKDESSKLEENRTKMCDDDLEQEEDDHLSSSEEERVQLMSHITTSEAYTELGNDEGGGAKLDDCDIPEKHCQSFDEELDKEAQVVSLQVLDRGIKQSNIEENAVDLDSFELQLKGNHQSITTKDDVEDVAELDNNDPRQGGKDQSSTTKEQAEELLHCIVHGDAIILDEVVHKKVVDKLALGLEDVEQDKVAGSQIMIYGVVNVQNRDPERDAESTEIINTYSVANGAAKFQGKESETMCQIALRTADLEETPQVPATPEKLDTSNTKNLEKAARDAVKTQSQLSHTEEALPILEHSKSLDLKSSDEAAELNLSPTAAISPLVSLKCSSSPENVKAAESEAEVKKPTLSAIEVSIEAVRYPIETASQLPHIKERDTEEAAQISRPIKYSEVLKTSSQVVSNVCPCPSKPSSYARVLSKKLPPTTSITTEPVKKLAVLRRTLKNSQMFANEIFPNKKENNQMQSEWGWNPVPIQKSVKTNNKGGKQRQSSLTRNLNALQASRNANVSVSDKNEGKQTEGASAWSSHTLQTSVDASVLKDEKRKQPQIRSPWNNNTSCMLADAILGNKKGDRQVYSTSVSVQNNQQIPSNASVAKEPRTQPLQSTSGGSKLGALKAERWSDRDLEDEDEDDSWREELTAQLR